MIANFTVAITIMQRKRKQELNVILILSLLILGTFPDAFKFQENLKKLREMLQEPTLRELFKKSINPDVGCSTVFKAAVSSARMPLTPIIGM